MDDLRLNLDNYLKEALDCPELYHSFVAGIIKGELLDHNGLEEVLIGIDTCFLGDTHQKPATEAAEYLSWAVYELRSYDSEIKWIGMRVFINSWTCMKVFDVPKQIWTPLMKSYPHGKKDKTCRIER